MRTLTRRGAVGIVSALACLSSGLGFSGAAHAADSVTLPPPGTVVPLTQAGTAVGWGAAGSVAFGDFSLPAELQKTALTSVSLGGSFGLATTAAGKVVTWGNDATVAGFPASLGTTRVVQAVAGAASGGAAAVTADGKVIAYLSGGSAAATEAFTDTSALTDVASISLVSVQPWGVALTRDGAVKAWGSNLIAPTVVTAVPTLTNVTEAVACSFNGMALTSDGAVHVWGQSNALLTAAPTSGVAQIACHASSGLALKTDGTLAVWGGSISDAVPADLQTALASGDDHVVSIASQGSGTSFAALDSQGKIWVWGAAASTVAAPASLTGAPVAELVVGGSTGNYALVTKVLPAAKPTVTGTVKVGQTLTGKAGTFSGTPDSVTNQWLANGSPIAGATGTTYKVAAGDVGKTISYRSTAKTGSDTVSSDSTPTAKVPAVSGGTVTQKPGGNGTVTAQQNPKLIKDLAQLKKDQAKLKKAKKKLKKAKKAHNANKVKKLKKKVKTLKKHVKADKKHIRADR